MIFIKEPADIGSYRPPASGVWEPRQRAVVNSNVFSCHTGKCQGWDLNPGSLISVALSSLFMVPFFDTERLRLLDLCLTWPGGLLSVFSCRLGLSIYLFLQTGFLCLPVASGFSSSKGALLAVGAYCSQSWQDFPFMCPPSSLSPSPIFQEGASGCHSLAKK